MILWGLSMKVFNLRLTYVLHFSECGEIKV